MSTDAATLRQIARRTAGGDDNFVRLLENILDRLDAAETVIDANTSDIAGFSSYSPFLGVGYIYDDDTVDEEHGLLPDVEHFSGEGIAAANLGASNFRGFSIVPGTYFATFMWQGTTGPDVMLRHHSSAPATDAALQTLGTLIHEHDTNFSGNVLSAMLTRTTAGYIWGVNADNGADMENAGMVVQRLA